MRRSFRHRARLGTYLLPPPPADVSQRQRLSLDAAATSANSALNFFETISPPHHARRRRPRAAARRNSGISLSLPLRASSTRPPLASSRSLGRRLVFDATPRAPCTPNTLRADDRDAALVIHDMLGRR